MKLSILICTLPKRINMLNTLLKLLNLQHNPDVEILFNNDEQISIGKKRNDLLKASKGKYVCFVDDDDIVDAYYVDLLMEGIKKGADCCSLKGIMTTNGNNPEIFEHSIKYKSWKTTENEIKYERYPNHLNCIKASIAKKIKFPEKNFGEDHDWSKQLHESGLLKTEHYIEQPIYFYKYISKK